MTQVDNLPLEARRTYSAGHEVRRVFAFGVPKKVFYVVGANLIVAVLFMLISGFVLTGLTWIVLSIVACIPLAVRVAGHSGYELGLLWRGFRKQSRTGRNVLRAGPLSNAPGGRTRLPGVAAPTEMWWGIDKLGRRFGMIRMHSTSQYTVSLRVTPQGIGGMQQEVVNLMVADWGELLNSAGQPGDVEGIVVVAETIPETGARLKAEIDRLCHPDAPAAAVEMIRQAGRGRAADRSGSQLLMRVSITWAARTDAKKKDPMVMLADLSERIPAFCDQLARSGVVADPLSDHQLAATVRRCFDPREETEAAVEDVVSNKIDAVDWLDAGPLTADQTSDTYFHDGACSRVWVMSRPPSGFPTERVLEKLIAGRPDVARKRITLIHRPLPPGDAAASVHADHLAAAAAVNSTRGLASARAGLQVAATQQARREEASGSGVTDYGMIITVSARDIDELDGLGEIAKDMAASARLSIRPAWWSQPSAFLAGIGVGVLLPDHASVAKTVRGA
ncbi:hypothetical protein JGU71_29095 [Antrihabitans sp. YC3-6]|uniref:PrgI family protein n=1 Tax=Antrihabitans stalagmiti TaxID=2799499 RepID=A0A934NXG9_9NOCA|nr:SCO6880 family protein [Antrihabitans stalagmiti]MBJ8342950.1 hypothetical protein [Antrihabitans stalagmiti]